MGIGDKLRSRRMELGLTRNQLAQKVCVTPSAIANYENDISTPKTDILISLINVLGVDANYLHLDYLSNNVVRSAYGHDLSQEEKDSIEKYRQLDENSKQLVRMIVDSEYQRIHREEWVSFPCLIPGIQKANTGFLLQERPITYKIRRKDIPSDLAFCFQIQADEYEPVFKKYDVLALSDQQATNNEMGIFCLNKVCYIRSLRHDDTGCRLRALNVMDPDIEVLPEDNFHCIGKIIGKVNGLFDLDDSSPGSLPEK